MRIGIDATTIYTARPTGLGIYSINIINELARLHDDLIVWTVDDSSLKLDPDRIRKVLRAFHFLGNHLFQLRPFWVEYVLPKLMARENIDVLYTTIPNGLMKSPVPHVVTVHDLIPLTFPADAPRSVRWNFKYRLPAILGNAAGIIAVSRYTKQDVINHYRLPPDKIHVVGEGYALDHFRPDVDLAVLDNYGLQPKKYVLYVGNSSARKNVPRLIKAFGMVKDHVPHRLVLAGTKYPHERRALVDEISRSGLTDRALLLDYIPYSELPALYAGADLFAFLSLYEGFGLPVLEAMACGTPVLTSRTTSLTEVAADAGLLADPLSVEDIADNLQELLLNPKKKKSVAVAGLEHCRQFRWAAAAREIYNILQEVSGS
ncbi:MAG: glycosyltransferase family 1 protein [Thermodesulfobacteriota bacterium]